MIAHYLKSAFRSLWKNKVFTGINVLGLAVSFSIAIVIYLIVDYHFSFDEFHEDKDRIFRITTTTYLVDDEFPNSGVPIPLSEVVKSEIPSVEASAYFHTYWTKDAAVSFGDNDRKVFQEGNSNRIFTDSKYFELFKYKWLTGSKESLSEPYNVVLTEELAHKYFGGLPYEGILGKEIIFHNDPPVKVSGIVKSFDQPTELVFKAFISLSTLDDPQFEIYKDWDGVNSADQLFVKLNKNISPIGVENQIQDVEKKYANIEETGRRTYELQPIKDIHFNGKYSNYNWPRAHKPTLYVLITITVLLLLLSCINFINLTTALTDARTKEIGVRKTLGSLKAQLVLHMMLETFVVVLVASAITLTLLPPIFQVFSDFIPHGISPSEIIEWKNLMIFFTLILLVTFVSGFFPVSSLSKYQQINLLKTYFMKEKGSKRYGYQVLTILQFSISILIIIVTLSMQKQILFSLNKDLGYQTEAIINFREPSQKKEILSNKIREIPGVLSVSLAGPPPASASTFSSTFDFEYEGGQSEIHSDVKYGDSTFVNLYGIKLLFGRNLRSGDSTKCLVNQAFLRRIKSADPSKIIGQYLGDKQIVGIVEDFHMKSTYTPINPAMITPQERNFNILHVKLHRENVYSWEKTIKEIEAAWHEISDDDFNYQFYDDQIAAFYSTEKSMVKLLAWVSGITIFISCLGLLGMAVFSINQRIKEIGIRKVNGAKVSEILILLNKDFVKWVTIAFVMASPIAYFVMNKWLENFAYRTELSWRVFALAGVLTLGIALLTVSWQSWKAGTRNPVEALRYE